MFLKIKKIIGLTAGIIFVIAWFYAGSLEGAYVNYPRFSDPKAGLTVPHAVKGIVVFITKEDQELLSWLLWVQIGSGAVAGLVFLIHRGDPFKSEK
ncbi:hypothetical protein [Nitrosospira sp. NpAV]|uniref:hypothetical protein n=1 Tax=Nitrosospira sp. NpAV TaxID=58133 RepID=UPI00059EE2FA|nr:hypothetical protein [Nitrosospira sp. NpAV]KIO49108.1 hypothetical protein SQ11_07325 [Nitrosospira sp. NpAV]